MPRKGLYAAAGAHSNLAEGRAEAEERRHNKTKIFR